MKIAFLSSLNPYDISNWSGTLYYIFNSLQKHHFIEWIGQDLIKKVKRHHIIQHGQFSNIIFECYAELFGTLLTNDPTLLKYDIIIARDYFLIAYLQIPIPIIYIGDTTYNLFKEYCGIKDPSFDTLAEKIEKKAINNVDWIVYSSEWAKENAVKHYGANPNKIKVIEFGANLDDILIPPKVQHSNVYCCNLLFIGKNWEHKGGKKAYETYILLKKRGFNCSLTIIGCDPSMNLVDTTDSNLHIISSIDKSNPKDQLLLIEILNKSHFLILPTFFDCYGIVFCEASAFGIPSLASDVGGVHQIIRNGQNGYLMSKDASAIKYSQLIYNLFTNKKKYFQLCKSTRKEFENRLNWNIWVIRFNNLLNQAILIKSHMLFSEEKSQYYIPTYIITQKREVDRIENIYSEFNNKSEFRLKIINISKSPSNLEYWKSIVKIVKMAIKQDDDIIIVCKDNHYFTDNYSTEFLFRNTLGAQEQGADILTGGLVGFDYAVPVAKNRYWVNHFSNTQFMIIYKKFYQTLLNYNFNNDDVTEAVISQLSNNIMTLYPFISKRKEYKKNNISDPYEQLENQSDILLNIIHQISNSYNYNF